MKVRYPRLLVLGIRLELAIKRFEEFDARWQDWLERRMSRAVAIVAIVATIVSLYAAEAVLCSAQVSSCTLAGPALGQWLFPKK